VVAFVDLIYSCVGQMSAAAGSITGTESWGNRLQRVSPKHNNGWLRRAALTRCLWTMWFGMTPLDPLTFVGVSMTFAHHLAFVASYLRRGAATVEPLIA
jgi:hypothetical protein